MFVRLRIRAFWGERKARAVTEQTIFANKQNTSRTGTSFVPKNVTRGKSIASAFGACTPDVSDARAKLSSRADIFGGAFGTSVVSAVESSSSMTTTTTLGEEETKTCLLKNIYMHPFSKKSCLSLSYFRVLKFRVPQKEEEEEEEQEEEDLDDKNARDSQRRRRRRRRRMASAKVMTPPTTTTVRRVT